MLIPLRKGLAKLQGVLMHVVLIVKKIKNLNLSVIKTCEYYCLVTSRT